MRISKPGFKEAFMFWFQLGWISFGGPAGQIALMHEFLVDKKKWISDAKFLHALQFCMILPGPEAQQLATYIGWLLHGTKGGIVAGVLFVLPSVLILLILSTIYVLYGSQPGIHALLYGLKPAVVAIVILALIKMAKKSLKTYFHYFIAAISFIALYFFHVPFPALVSGAIILGLLGTHFLPRFFYPSSAEYHDNGEEERYILNKNSLISDNNFSFSSFFNKIFWGICLWSLPLLCFYFCTNHFKFWKTLSVFFTKAALVTFGGAYAVLPYVAQVSVEKLKWLSKMEMIDGLALGETTPGPLIMVLAFVGFMGGYHILNSLSMACLALLTTTFYTFLPSILFILIGAPIVERTQESRKISTILSVVSAAVVGVILNLTIYIGFAVLFPSGFDLNRVDYLSLTWIFISYLALNRWKTHMALWIVISALMGLARYLALHGDF